MVKSNTITIDVVQLSVTLPSAPFTDTQIPSFVGTGATAHGTVNWSVTSPTGATNIQTGSVTADGTGYFTGSLNAPLPPASGNYTLIVTDKTTGDTASNTFAVTYSSPASVTITSTATTVPANTTVTFNGSVLDGAGYAIPNVTVYLFINGVQQASGSTGGSGVYAFSVTFSTAGTYQVDVSTNTSNT